MVLSSFKDVLGCPSARLPKEEVGEGKADVLTINEPDRCHGDGKEQPGAQVHLHQYCSQDKQQ